MLEPSELFPEIPNLYEFPSIHAEMLFDEERVTRYSDAIAATIREGDIVADIGTGTGLLAFLSLDAGAKRVHAIERSPAIQWARRIAERNGYIDRIVFHEQDSRSCSLPEKVDVIVSELLGHMAFEEGMVESVFDARRRFLREGGRVIPQRVDLCVALAYKPDIFSEYIDIWNNVRGIDYSVLREEALKACYVTGIADRDLISEPRILIRVDFESDAPPDFHGELMLTAYRDGDVNGVGLWFDANLAPGVRLSSGPWSRTHWHQCFAPIAEPMSVLADESLALVLNMNMREEPSDNFSVSVTLKSERRHAEEE